MSFPDDFTGALMMTTCNCNDKPFCHCGHDATGHDQGHEQDHRDEFSELYLELGGEG